METSPTIQPPDETGFTPQPRVTVRYWAAARAAAGRVEERFTGATVADVLALARLAHHDDPRFSRVLDACSLLLGDRPVGTRDLAAVDVSDGDVIEVLPPFAGG